MIEIEDVKVGTYVWWKASNIIVSWSCPAIITEISEESFKVISFNNFEETSELKMSDYGPDGSCRSEMKICTKEGALAYINDKKKLLENDVIATQKLLTEYSNKADSYINGLKDDKS